VGDTARGDNTGLTERAFAAEISESDFRARSLGYVRGHLKKRTFTYANEQDLSLRDFDCARLDAFRNSFKDLGITVKVGKGLAEAVHFVSRTRIHQALKARHVIRHFAEQRHIIQPGCS
jgi:hypothetical protein